MPRSGIGPTLIAALIVGVEIESRAVVESAAGTDKELLHGIIDQLGLVESSSVTGEKRRCHIEAVEPYLVRINEFMPKCPLMGTGLACQLTDKNVHRLFVLGIARLVIDVEKHFSGVDEIEIVIGHLIEVDLALIVDKGIGPLGHIIIVLAVAGVMPHVEHGATAHTLSITEEETLTVIELPSLGCALHLRLSKLDRHFLSRKGKRTRATGRNGKRGFPIHVFLVFMCIYNFQSSVRNGVAGNPSRL